MGKQSIDKSSSVAYNDPEIKAAFYEEFVPTYLDHVQETINGRDITDLLYMAFRRGYISRGDLE